LPQAYVKPESRRQAMLSEFTTAAGNRGVAGDAKRQK
jgi:hypothetical protein